MILPDFILPSRQNQVWAESGIDSYAECKDKKHFKSYPHKVEYRYNSRGFRDIEWPETLEELKECIWCFGDSFTVGIGSPIDHIWPNILQNKINCRCINVSMDGASNNWIARKAARVLNEISPKYIVIHWSFITRYEDGDESLRDEHRRRHVLITETHARLIDQFNKLINQIEAVKNKSNIIHSFIPNYLVDKKNADLIINRIWQSLRGNDWPLSPPLDRFQLMNLDPAMLSELTQVNAIDYLIKLYNEQVSISQLTNTFNKILYIPEITKQDLARDGHHYDSITATNFVEQLVDLISFPHRDLD
jgi:hypothetical protein